ncbi:MAG: B12-binding domain-containing radical SAM protein [Planctomycetes bacterium]|nr:B12-binding domain-containing radical SAM protein [Planctomycetota bacterium]
MADLPRKRRRLRIVIPAFPAFNIYSRIARKTTALGPVCVATAVHEIEGWDAEVIDENNLGRYGPRSPEGGADHEVLQEQRPADVVGLYGGLTSTAPRLYELARFYRQRGIVTIAGGQHFAGENAEEALRHGVDYIVFGEGERTIRELLQAVEGRREASSIKGIAYLEQGRVIRTPDREPLTDFDELPYPDFSLVRYAKIVIYPVERIRGCCMNCEFCTVKGKPRCASVDRLLGNISHLVETHNARQFFIVDDLFGQQRDETVRFCHLLADYQRRIGTRVEATVQIRLDKAKDPELLTAMRQAGIKYVAIGFESPIDEELRAMNKAIHSREMLSLVRVFHQFGFLIHGMFIFGYPLAESASFRMPAKERVQRFRSFIRKAKIDTVQVLLPVPLPGTDLRRRLEQQNRIYALQDVGWEYYDGNFPLFEPDEPMTAQEIQEAGKQIMRHVYRFRYALFVAANILLFPSIAFYLHNLKLGWGRWYRSWRNSLIRFGGWITMRKWSADFGRGDFLRRLQAARDRLALSQKATPVRQEANRASQTLGSTRTARHQG